MATPKYFDPADIETQARYRPGVASNIFNVLTGGLAGQISGSTQRAQEAARARQALLQEDLDKRTEQRMIERMKLQQDEILKRQIQLENERTQADLLRRSEEAAGAEDVLGGNTFVGPVSQSRELGRRTARLQRLATGEKEASEKAGLIGRLNAEMGATEKAAIESGIMPDYSKLDINTLRRMAGASDVSQRQKLEARQAKLDEGKVFVSRNAAGDVSVQGPSDLVQKFQSLNPDFFKKKKDSPYKVSMRETEDQRSFNVDFGEMTADEIKAIAPQLEDMKKAYGASSRDDLSGAGGEGTKTFPKGPSREKGEPMVGRNDGKVRSPGPESTSKPKSEAAASVMAEMYGPLSPSEQFTKTGRQLKALEGRGGTYTYGASQTLTDPFYESVASELGTKPQRIGQESVLVKGAKSVIANEFPTEQWNSLPQEVKNRIYIEALNKSAAEMSKPQTSRGYNRSPFADISYQRD
jgi:hypothetical protein